MKNNPILVENRSDVISYNNKRKSEKQKISAFSRKLEMIFEEIGPKKTKNVLIFWHMMQKLNSNAMSIIYGVEPDQNFVDMAVSMSKNDMKRVVNNAKDLIADEKPFMPTCKIIKRLAQQPTKLEIKNAMRDLCIESKPIKYLNRVNRYIKKWHYKEILRLKGDMFEQDFETLYVMFWHDVIVNNVDLRAQSQVDGINCNNQNKNENWWDKKIKKDLQDGRAFDHPFGERIISIMAQKKVNKSKN